MHCHETHWTNENVDLMVVLDSKLLKGQHVRESVESHSSVCKYQSVWSNHQLYLLLMHNRSN